MSKLPKRSGRQNADYLAEWGEGDDITDSRRHERRVVAMRKKEESQHGFDCSHCKGWISIHPEMGTHNRNHCPSCLWSRHMDGDKSGDRRSECRTAMEPIALTFKETKPNKYATEADIAVGALMVVHRCQGDDHAIRINQLVADDNPVVALKIFEDSVSLPEDVVAQLDSCGVRIASPSMTDAVLRQLFGGAMSVSQEINSKGSMV